jgi:nucleoside-diphosphate-sugar epimerase
MRIAVTGGNGDMGRSLTPYLLEQGHSVVSIDRFLPPGPPLPPKNTANYFVADVTNFGEVVASISGCDAVIHLAAHTSPLNSPHPTIYADNTTGSYNILYAAAALGIKRVCLASSVNAIGGAFSRAPQYDYFPLDEQHPTYAEDPYSLSKWVLEQQADSFARRYEWMTIASFRFHWLVETLKHGEELTDAFGDTAIRHLWAYTLLSEANTACYLSITADFHGHESFYIVAPQTAVSQSSSDLANKHYPTVTLRKEFVGTSSFFDSSKAGRILGWQHQEK